MALHDLKITVVDGGSYDGVLGNSSPDNIGEKSPSGQKSTLYRVLNYNNTIKSKLQNAMSPTAFFAVEQGTRLATQIGREAISYVVSNVGRASGDSQYQATVSRKIEVITDVLDFGQGFINGAAAGSIVGPIGAIVGAAVGAISSFASLGFKYAERERAYQHELFKENTSQAYQLARANYSAYTGRLR